MATQYYTASSLDGFIATEDDSLDWLFQLDDVDDTSYPAFIAQVGALAMGASTYRWMLRHVIKAGSDAPGDWPYAQPWQAAAAQVHRLSAAATRVRARDGAGIRRTALQDSGALLA